MLLAQQFDEWRGRLLDRQHAEARGSAVGATWTEVGAVLLRVSPGALVVLGLVWIAGLWSHSFVLAASLPGLTKRRGLTLSLTGSAAANVLPLGGAAGTALNFAMVRR